MLNWLIRAILLMSLIAPTPAQAASAASCAITSPTNGATITGPITITGTYTKAYQVVIAFNAGVINDVHMDDPDGDGTGAWSYTWDPSSPLRYSGDVEITVRCSALSDRYWRWNSLRVKVNIPANEPPVVSIVGPAEGASVSGQVPIVIAASDTQGLSKVEVRVNWGDWQAAILQNGKYVYTWDTAGLGDKTHAVEARATDKHGNVTQTATTYVRTGAGTNEPAIVKQADRAMWVWEAATYQLLENPGARRVLAQFMEDPAVSPHPIKTLYLYADRYDGAYALVENPRAYRAFIKWAHARGYYVHALFGSGHYMAPMLSYSRYHAQAVALMENVLNYNLSSAPEERFDGVNIDIEPHVLGDWPDKPTVQLQYLDMLDKMMQRKAASGQNLNVGPAIPRWLDVSRECVGITWRGKTAACAQHVQDITDYISIMDYRDEAGGPAGIIASARDEIAYAHKTGKQVVIGVETGQISATGDPEVITFQEEGRADMENQLGLVYQAFRGAAAFIGVAVHHYDSYRELPTVWNAQGTRWRPAAPDKANPTVPTKLTAAPWDWQQVDLHWRRSHDDGLVVYYEVHRSIIRGFIPGASTLARTTPFNFIKDWGLLPDTTYYYKVVAVDASGKKSAASAEAAARTPAGVGRVPLRIESITLSGSSGAVAAVKVVNAITGEPVSKASVFGHWEGAAGSKFNVKTNANGVATVKAETVRLPATVIFVPEKILADGYYWAYSLDAAYMATKHFL